MNYTIRVANENDELVDTIQGQDINDVLHKVVKLKMKAMDWGTESEYKKIRIRLSKEMALITTTNIQKNTVSEFDILKKAIDKIPELPKNFLLSEFNDKNPEPIEPKMPEPPTLLEIPPKPNPLDNKYLPKLGLTDKMFSSRKQNILAEADSLYKNDYKKWEEQKSKIEDDNKKIQSVHLTKINLMQKEYEQKYDQWYIGWEKVFNQQKKFRNDYELKVAEVVEKYCELILLQSHQKLDFYEKKIFLKYTPDTSILFIEYHLPDRNSLTNIKEIKYVSARDEFEEVSFTENALNKRYEDVLYEITLRSLNELFLTDKSNAIDSIIFNGIVESTDPSTGQKINPCIISISVSKQKFLSLNLKGVILKDCFRGLKGISAAQLHTLTPIPPIMEINKEDKRFVEGYDVVKDIDNSTHGD